MYYVTVLATDKKTDCPIYKFEDWDMASSFILFQLQQNYRCEVSSLEEKAND